MDLQCMSLDIIKMIDKQYKKIIDNECLDIKRIKDFCNLYVSKQSYVKTVNLSDLIFSSPEFEKVSYQTKINNILKTTEFKKKYTHVIRIIFACLKMGVEMFNINDGIATLKNNYQFIKSLEQKKKQMISSHILILKAQYKDISKKIDTDYELYFQDYMTKIKIIDKIILSTNNLIINKHLQKTDNLLTLLLPYFYTYTEYIEEYN